MTGRSVGISNIVIAYERYTVQNACINMIPIMATVRKWRGKICLAFLFRVSLCFRLNKKNNFSNFYEKESINQV